MTSEIADTTPASRIGQCIDERYMLEAEIGVGGLGSVYRATHVKLARQVAVKLLHEHFGGSGLQRGRFEREARALAAIDHQNIVSVMDFGISEAQPYLVMELLEGETLAPRLKRGLMPLEMTLSIAQQLLSALSFMHAAGLVHRDLKPSNVFLQRQRKLRDRVKVLDFGLAKFMLPGSTSESDATLTRDGTVVGTPAYMSPEQATGDHVDARGDVYAVGVLLFQMLTGHLPYQGDAIEQVRSHLVAPIPPLRRDHPDRILDSALERLIHRALAKRREDRFNDAGQMLQSLRNIMRTLGRASLLEPAEALIAAEPVVELTSAEIQTLPESGEALTAVDEALPFLERARNWIVTGVRVVSAISVLLVAGTVTAIVVLLPAPADRAELVVLRKRVADRLIERSFGRKPAAQQPVDRVGSTSTAGASAEPAVPLAIDAADAGTAFAPPPSDAGAPIAYAAGSGSAATLTSAGSAAAPTAGGSAAAMSAPADPWVTAPSTQAQPKAANPNVPGPTAATNPWARNDTPRELRALRKSLSNGWEGNDRTLISLRTYNQQHPDDARGRLLLAMLFMNRHWRPDALQQFSAALQADFSARGAPEVLPTLLGLVVQGKLAHDAQKLIVRVYGSEAIASIDKLVPTVEDAAAVARLNTLRARISPAPPAVP